MKSCKQFTACPGRARMFGNRAQCFLKHISADELSVIQSKLARISVVTILDKGNYSPYVAEQTSIAPPVHILGIEHIKSLDHLNKSTARLLM
jgi:hypothetical protein